MKNKKIKSRFFVLAAAGLMLMTSLPAQGQEPINSNYGGVQIGAITYSFRSIREVDAVLQACVDAGLSSVELMGTGVEAYLGAPESTVSRRRMRASDLTDEEKGAIEKYQKEIVKWRYSDDTMDKYVKLRKKFNDAGVGIHIYKWTAGMSDKDLDYSFKVAKTLGAIGITTEIGEENCTKVGAAAERAGMVAIFHNHYQYADEDFDVDKLLALSPANRLNFDIGHYLGSTGKDPVAFIEKYHDQIASIHIKDKTAKAPEGSEVKGNENMPFGQGDTPVNEVLQLIQKNNWPIYCDIELEYKVPEGSDAVKETAICREYCKLALE
ncbi:MAG: sugar phosphate isomerase/epimerase [Bacteroidetes bacterium]|nr:sugar phosphate isomerase/epimerase [Bacteroidota bacterium]